MPLNLDDDVVTLTAALIDVPSVSHAEARLADLVEEQLRDRPHLHVERVGDNIVARTRLGRPSRILLGGHLDTVPPAGNEVAVVTEEAVAGLGAVDMKGALAVSLALAAELTEPIHDVTYIYYACEEVESRFNGLGVLLRERPDLLAADLAILMEPSSAGIEAGCQGTLRATVAVEGVRAHSARPWMGRNAVHEAGEVLDRLRGYAAERVSIDGLEYRESLSAVAIEGGVAGNVVPDRCTVTVNYRYAPSRSAAEAESHVRGIFDGFEVTVVDNAAGALPGLDRPAAADFAALVGTPPRPKFGWTDVARFAALGVPALNFGPGDPALAHHRDEAVAVVELRSVHTVLREWLAPR